MQLLNRFTSFRWWNRIVQGLGARGICTTGAQSPGRWKFGDFHMLKLTHAVCSRVCNTPQGSGAQPQWIQTSLMGILVDVGGGPLRAGRWIFFSRWPAQSAEFFSVRSAEFFFLPKHAEKCSFGHFWFFFLVWHPPKFTFKPHFHCGAQHRRRNSSKQGTPTPGEFLLVVFFHLLAKWFASGPPLGP